MELEDLHLGDLVEVDIASNIFRGRGRVTIIGIDRGELPVMVGWNNDQSFLPRSTDQFNIDSAAYLDGARTDFTNQRWVRLSYIKLVVKPAPNTKEELCRQCGVKCFTTDTKCWWCETANPTRPSK